MKSVDEEHKRMEENNVWQPVELQQDVPKGAKVLTLTWACKQKANGVKQQARVQAGGRRALR